MYEALGPNATSTRPVGKNSSFDATTARIFPNAEYDPQTQFATTHKNAFRREHHVPAATSVSSQLPRRAALQRAALVEQAKAIHAEQKAELEARIAQAQSDGAATPFSHREPMNRARTMDFHREPIQEDPLSTAPISIYSEQKLRQSKVPLTAENLFARNSDFSTPVELYSRGNRVWKDVEE